MGRRSVMQIAPEEGTLLALLVASIGARNVVEIGTFTGYSALCMARALPPGGKLLACDVSEEYTAVARRFWQKAGVADRIELVLGPAADTLRALPESTRFDFGFIDADKSNYVIYYEEILQAAPARRSDRDRQRAVERPGDPRDRPDRRHARDSRDQRARRRRSARAVGDDRRLRRHHARAQARLAPRWASGFRSRWSARAAPASARVRALEASATRAARRRWSRARDPNGPDVRGRARGSGRRRRDPVHAEPAPRAPGARGARRGQARAGRVPARVRSG